MYNMLYIMLLCRMAMIGKSDYGPGKTGLTPASSYHHHR